MTVKGELSLSSGEGAGVSGKWGWYNKSYRFQGCCNVFFFGGGQVDTLASCCKGIHTKNCFVKEIGFVCWRTVEKVVLIIAFTSSGNKKSMHHMGPERPFHPLQKSVAEMQFWIIMNENRPLEISGRVKSSIPLWRRQRLCHMTIGIKVAQLPGTRSSKNVGHFPV